VSQNTRLKSSFIYLANAVNDLRGNWATLALVLAPLVVLAAICLLPDALNLQHALAEKFAPAMPGSHNVGWMSVQEPFMPSADTPVAPLFPAWIVLIFHLLFLLLTIGVSLLVLCTLRRIQSGAPRLPIASETMEVYRAAVRLAPAYMWVTILQLALPVISLTLVALLSSVVSIWWVLLIIYTLEIALLTFATLAYLWLYFAQYALVFDNRRSFHALLFSRDLIRKRFFRVAVRIVVFLAVWSGYDSWAAATFVIVSNILGPVGAIAGYLIPVVFVVDLAAVAVAYITVAFFFTAGSRLYQDLRQIALESAANGIASSVTLPAAGA
jgi:hypothetical protein